MGFLPSRHAAHDVAVGNHADGPIGRIDDRYAAAVVLHHQLGDLVKRAGRRAACRFRGHHVSCRSGHRVLRLHNRGVPNTVRDIRWARVDPANATVVPTSVELAEASTHPGVAAATTRAKHAGTRLGSYGVPRALECGRWVILAVKLGFPKHAESAAGSIASGSVRFLNDHLGSWNRASKVGSRAVEQLAVPDARMGERSPAATSFVIGRRLLQLRVGGEVVLDPERVFVLLQILLDPHPRRRGLLDVELVVRRRAMKRPLRRDSDRGRRSASRVRWTPASGSAPDGRAYARARP